MSVFTLIIFISAVLSIMASADPYVLNGGIRQNLERRQGLAPSETISTATSSAPTPIKGVPVALDRTTASPTVVPNGPQAGTTSSAGGVKGTPASNSSPVGLVGTPGTHSSNFFNQHTINSNLPNYAVLIIIILSGFLFFGIGALSLFRYRRYRERKTENRRKLEDEEDVFDKYNKHWKSKRDSGSKVSSPMDNEKGGS